jgi:Xaa-Pro aminopeptidase
MNNILKEYDAVLISNPANVIYLIGDFGFSHVERECFLLFQKNKKIIITDKRYSQAIKQKTSGFEVIDIGAFNFIKNDPTRHLKKLKARKLGIEKDNLTVYEFEELKKFGIKPNKIDISNLRTIKTSTEINKIKKASKIADLAFKYILEIIMINTTETDISNKIEIFVKSMNADLAFKPIIAFGKNSSIPHHLSSNSKLKNGQIILMDFGVKFENYRSDMTRTIYFGSAPDKFKQIYLHTLRAQKLTLEFIQNQLKQNKQIYASKLDSIARNYLIGEGFPEMIHSLGHGIGLEVHEKPFLSPNS